MNREQLTMNNGRARFVGGAGEDKPRRTRREDCCPSDSLEFHGEELGVRSEK